jgi:murein L,D-transpeptidase YafK
MSSKLSGQTLIRFLSFLLTFLFCFPCLINAQNVPLYLMKMGENSNSYALLVDKKDQVVCLYKHTPDGPYLVKTYRCTTGKNNNGSKIHEGDKKTPNGIYFFRGILEDKQLPEKYGVRAFPIDYPNDYDRLENKTGSGIWLHAVNDDSRVEQSYDTEGCVVVTNSDIMDLSRYITTDRTPIIVDDSIVTVSPEKFNQDKEKLQSFLTSWVDAWQNKEIDRYMDCYHDRFYGTGRNKAEQRAHKQRLNKQYSKIKVNISDISIYRYHNYIVTSFIQEYRSNLFNSKGPKRLYLVPDQDSWKIISERFRRW